MEWDTMFSERTTKNNSFKIRINTVPLSVLEEDSIIEVHKIIS